MSENYVYDLAMTDSELNQAIREQLQYEIEQGSLANLGYDLGMFEAQAIPDILVGFILQMAHLPTAADQGISISFDGFLNTTEFIVAAGSKEDMGKALAASVAEFVAGAGLTLAGVTFGCAASTVLVSFAIAEGAGYVFGESWDYLVTSDLKWTTDVDGLVVAEASSSGTPLYVFDRWWDTLHKHTKWELELNHPDAQSVVGHVENENLYYFGKAEADLSFLADFLKYAPKEFTVAFNADTPDTGVRQNLINYFAWTGGEMEAAIKNGDKYTLWAALALKPYVTSKDDLTINSLDPGKYSQHFLEDRVLFLNQLVHPATASFTGKHIIFKDLTSNPNRTAETADTYGEFSNVEGSSEYIFGTDSADTISSDSWGSFDHLYGMGGNDTLSGGLGEDWLEGGKGQDTLNGGAGNDFFTIQGTDTDYDIYNGGDDNDTILGSSGDDTIRVTSLSLADNSIEIIDGGAGEDSISGTGGNNTIDLTGITVSNIERIEGGAGQDTLIGTDGDDVLYGGTKETEEDNAIDTLKGGIGNDEYHVGNGDIINDADHQGTIWLEGQQLPLAA